MTFQHVRNPEGASRPLSGTISSRVKGVNERNLRHEALPSQEQVRSKPGIIIFLPPQHLSGFGLFPREAGREAFPPQASGIQSLMAAEKILVPETFRIRWNVASLTDEH